jgi:hypothetical protein
MQVYFTNKRRIVDSITGEVFDLEEEHGVWTWDKKMGVRLKLCLTQTKICRRFKKWTRRPLTKSKNKP